MSDSAVEKSLYISVLCSSILEILSSNEVPEPVEMSLFSIAFADGSGCCIMSSAVRLEFSVCRGIVIFTS